MADDARIKVGFTRHPKTQKLVRKLGHVGAWSWLTLLLHCASERWDGSLAGMQADDIAIAADWAGDPDEFVDALVALRLLDGQPGDFRLHDWAEHNPFAATHGKRVEAARAAANAKWDKVAALQDATRMRLASESHASRNAVSAKSQCPPHHTTPHHTTPPKKSAPDAAPAAELVQNPGFELAPDRKPGDFPEWLPMDAWDGYREMRKKIKAPMTDRAVTLALNELTEWRAAGEDVAQILDRSTKNAWRGLFSLRRPVPDAKRVHGPASESVVSHTRGLDADGTCRF